ncbi:MAG: metallophosphoesterase [bacterium]|nr:metallophosphoesterase [bacterium]
MKIAHISDFHLRHHLPGSSSLEQRRSRNMPDRISEAVHRMAAQSPDLVAVTGDLVDHPFEGMDDPENIRAGEKDLRLVRDLFAPLTCPVAFLFGNHDRPASFQNIYGDLPHDFTVAGHRILLFFDHEAQDHFPERTHEQLERFQAALSDNNPHPQIHLQHYLIAPTRNEGYPHTYRNATVLKRALQKDSRVRLVLNGHYHAGEPLSRDGHVYFSTARAFCEPPHPFRIYTLTEDQITQAEHNLMEAHE